MKNIFFVATFFVLSVLFILSCLSKTGFAQEGISNEQSSAEQGVPLSLERIYIFSRKYIGKKYTDEWMKLKAGDSIVFSNIQEVQEVYGPEKEKGIAQVTDFDRQAWVLVVSELLNTCKRAGVKSIERIEEDQIRIKVETLLTEPCKPKAGEERYQIIGMPIERPVAKVEVVLTSETVVLPLSQEEGKE